MNVSKFLLRHEPVSWVQDKMYVVPKAGGKHMAGAVPLGNCRKRVIGMSVNTQVRFRSWVGCPGHPGGNWLSPYHSP